MKNTILKKIQNKLCLFGLILFEGIVLIMKAIIFNEAKKMPHFCTAYDSGLLLPVAGRTVIEDIVILLKQCGIKEIFLYGKNNYSYSSSDLFEYKKLGVRVCDTFDKKIFDKDSTMIITGKGICRFNFDGVIDCHRENRAGITCVQNKNSETGVIENTGIYIFEPNFLYLIDECGESITLSDLIARKKMSESGKRIQIFEVFDSWIRIDNIEDYIKINLKSVNENNVGSKGRFIDKDIFVGENSMIAGTVKLTPPVMIGSNCLIGSDCEISGSVIGNDTIVESSASIKNSVILKNVSMGKHVNINNSVISDNVKLEDCFKAEKCSVGQRSICRSASAVLSGVDVSSDTVIEQGCVVEKSIDSCRDDMLEFDEDGLKFEFCRKQTVPETMAKLGCSLGTFYGFTSCVVIGYDADNTSLTAAYALVSGLMYSGINVKLLADTTLPVMRWICRQGLADGGVYVSAGIQEKLYILNSHGNDISSHERKRFEEIYEKNKFTSVPNGYIGQIEEMKNPEEFYTAYISEIFPEAYRSLSLDMRPVKDDIKDIVCAVMISKMYPEAPVFVPLNSFLAVSKILNSNKNLIRCGLNKGDIMAEMEKFIKIPGVYQQYLMMYDDFAFELALSHYKAINGLSEIRQIRIPNVRKRKLFIECNKNRESEIYDRLCDDEFIRKNFEIGDTLLHYDGKGYVRVLKDNVRHGFNIDVESFNEEYAEDLTTKINNIILSYNEKNV